MAAFARALGNGFTYDEGLVLVGAQRFLQSGSFGTLLSKDYFGARLEGTWRPFCTLTYMLDAMVSFHPAVFKFDSLFGHVVAAWLLMALTRRLLPEGRRRWAIVAGLLFALHPITAETVDNASFREDSLVTAFTLATLVLSLDCRRGAGAPLLRSGPAVEGVGGDRAGAPGDPAAREVRPREPPGVGGLRSR